MSKIFIDKRYFTGHKTKWVSFEDSPRLTETKGDIYSRCVPCITNLYEQLKQGKEHVRLGPAFSCWKVVVVLESMDECVELLAELEKRLFDPLKVKGRFGSVDEGKRTKVVVFNAAGESQREKLYEILVTCAGSVNPSAQVSFHRGCAELYHELFGDWKAWKAEETIRKPEAVPAILDRIRKVLFWEKDQGEQVKP
jgi:hypothetical protein